MKTWQIDSLHVAAYPTRAAMGEAAGLAAAAAIDQAITASGAARVILASAPSQNETLDTLLRQSIDWSRVTIFHMDEYFGLSAEHPASFRHYQKTHVLSRIHPHAFHGIQGESIDADEECGRYADLLREAPIDVVCLGIGENGHLAFNDPPVADFQDPEWVKIVELDQACRQQQVNDGCFATLGEVPHVALTLTIPALLSGKQLFCSAPGPRKAQAVHDTVRGPIATSCPASSLRRHTGATLYLDYDSAAQL